MPRRCPAAGAFTLIELMVVLALVTIVILLVRPNIEGIRPRRNLGAAGWRLANTVRWAQDAAISRRQLIRLLYDVAGTEYWVMIGDAELSRRQLPEGVSFASVRFGEEIMVIHDVAEAWAYPNGTISGHTVVLSNESGDQLTIEFNPLTGEVETELASHAQTY